MDTEIVMEMETEIDIDVDTDNYVAAANVATATSPARSRLAMDGTPRRRSTGAGSRGHHAQAMVGATVAPNWLRKANFHRCIAHRRRRGRSRG